MKDFKQKYAATRSVFMAPLSNSRGYLSFVVASLLVLSACAAQAKTLAYWRFEDGRAATPFKVGHDAVSDFSGEGNTLAVANAEVQPLSTEDVPVGTVLQTGAKNALSADFQGRNDFYTHSKKINSTDFSPIGSNAWTVEFSVRVRAADGVNRLLGRDSNSAKGERRGPIQFVAVGDNTGQQFDIRIEMLDGQDTFQSISSRPSYRIGRWYHVAATATATTLSLYVDELDGKSYKLVGTKSINGAANATKGAFSVGRGWNGKPADWMEGRIDEVRISDVALPPSQFLFVSPDGKAAVATPVTEPVLAPLPLFWGADPEVNYFSGQYWMYMTGRNISPGNPAFFAYSSPDRKVWKEHGPILQLSEIPWIGLTSRSPWAPGMATKNGKYYFYFSVGPQTRQQPSRIGVAVGDSPAGPFKDKGEPLLVGGNGFEAIDAMVFNDPQSDKSYLYAGGSNGAKLRIFELNPDMVSFAREIAVETPPEYTEGPFMHFHNGIYYLSYSHGFWRGASYSVHYAISTTPYGPWQYRGAILTSDTKHKGPGHHSFFQDPNSKQWYIAYHRWQNPNGGNPLGARSRSISIEPIQYGPNDEILPITMTDNAIPVLQANTQPK